jgi:hypothetical protein
MFDIAFVRHVCFDEVIPYQGVPRVAPGIAVLCGTLAALRSNFNPHPESLS